MRLEKKRGLKPAFFTPPKDLTKDIDLEYICFPMKTAGIIICLGMVFLMSGGKTIASPGVPGALRHQVEKGESLWAISRRYGVSVDEIARANKITDPTSLPAGQILVIPQDSYAYFEKHFPISSRVNPRPWRYIVIHHSATDEGSLRRFDYYHRRVRRMPQGMAYHFVIGNGHGSTDGVIEVGSRWILQQQGGHLRSLEQNEESLGICLVGNFDTGSPTTKQMESLVALTRYLQAKFSIPRGRVIGHRESRGERTECPGHNFSMSAFRRRLL